MVGFPKSGHIYDLQVITSCPSRMTMRDASTVMSISYQKLACLRVSYVYRGCVMLAHNYEGRFGIGGH